MNIKQNKSDFGSFLEGFKSRNLASVQEPALNSFHQIIEILQELRELFQKEQVEVNELDRLISDCRKLLKVAEKDDLVNTLDNLGAKLVAFMRISKSYSNLPDVIDDVYAELFSVYAKSAKMIEDNRLIKRAVEMGSLLDN
jgi:flagellar biosynthesis/type III secretory pathway chaperone